MYKGTRKEQDQIAKGAHKRKRKRMRRVMQVPRGGLRTKS